ncbi:MAG: diguanylate cyclase [Niameybacter sp.]
MLEEIYQAFLENIPWPTWITRIDSTVLFINKHYEEMYDKKANDMVGKRYKDALSTDIAEQYYQDLMRCVESGKVYKTGQLIKGRYLECTLFPIPNKDKKVVAVAGVVFDISEHKEREKEIRSRKDILRTIIDALPETIFYKDKKSHFLGYNKAFESYYNQRGIYEIEGKTDLEIYQDEQVAREFIESDQRVITDKVPQKYEHTIIQEDGGLLIEENTKVPVLDEKGEVWGIVGLSRDITDKKIFEEKLKYISETDTLTGLYNRYSFEEKIKYYHRKEYLPLGMIMGDVNGLKLVNDTLGHLEGDELLKDIAKVLNQTCANKGHIFRWGGDEFFILIPNCSEALCEKMIEEILRACNANEKKFINLSIALGEVVKYDLEEDIYDYIRKVEEKVYRKKLLETKSMKSSMLTTLRKSLEEKNMEINEHATRVVQHALAVGRAMQLKDEDLDELALSAELHDIGKITMPEELLLKADRLVNEEFEVLKMHAEKGYRIINASGELISVAKNVLTHHERWDGKGYPLGLKEKEIPLMARIINVVDAYDVMTKRCIYKEIMSPDQACEELKRCAATQFDPEIVKIFIDDLKSREQVMPLNNGEHIGS